MRPTTSGLLRRVSPSDHLVCELTCRCCHDTHTLGSSLLFDSQQHRGRTCSARLVPESAELNLNSSLAAKLNAASGLCCTRRGRGFGPANSYRSAPRRRHMDEACSPCVRQSSLSRQRLGGRLRRKSRLSDDAGGGLKFSQHKVLRRRRPELRHCLFACPAVCLAGWPQRPRTMPV